MSESSGAAGPVTDSRSAGVSIGTTALGSSAGVSGGAGGGKGFEASTTGGGVKAAGVSLAATVGGGSLGSGVASATGAGQSAGIGAARTGMSEKSTTGDKTAGMSSDKASAGVSIPDSVVSPLIGAGANVYIMTNELTQSMREKLGTSWPFVQDTLNSRYAKLLAGGLLASVAFIVVWKIIKRFSAKVKRPAESEDEEAYPWNTAKTYELTPVSEDKRQQGPRSEGDGYTLPAKIQLRIADTTLQGARPAPPEICKSCGLRKRPM